MVLLLGSDISGNGGNIRFANAESAVSGLPGKWHVPFLVDPKRRISLDDACDLCRGLRGTDADEHVDMIGSSIDDQGGASQLADDAPR